MFERAQFVNSFPAKRKPHNAKASNPHARNSVKKSVSRMKATLTRGRVHAFVRRAYTPSGKLAPLIASCSVNSSVLAPESNCAPLKTSKSNAVCLDAAKGRPALGL